MIDRLCVLVTFLLCTCASLLEGMEQAKLKRLLHEAYSDLDPATSSAKINKRLGLFREIDEPPLL